MHYVFIVNPKAGDKNRTYEVRRKVESYFLNTIDTFKVYETSKKGDATTIAANECERGEKVRIYGFGGDGTLLEIVRGAEGKTNAEVGIFPTGSGNDYIKTYGEPDDFLDFNRQINGKSISIDMIDTIGGSAINICSVGLDAKVAYQMIDFKNLPGIKGSLAYDLSLAKCLLSKIGNKLTVKMKTVEGKKNFTGTYLFALAAAGKWYGGGYMGAPKAITNDGLLDLILINKPPLYKIPGLVKLYKKGEHLSNPKFKDYMTFHRGYELEIISEEDMYCNRDGECEKLRYEKFSLSKGNLRFILPQGVVYGMKAIQTKRLILRNWREGDIDDYMEYATDENVMLAAGCQTIKTHEEGMQKLEKTMLHDRLCMAVELRETGKVIGGISIQEDIRRWKVNSKSLGYELNSKYWGKGYMPEAMKAAITYAFEELELEVLAVFHFTVNEKSKKVIEKCGFTHEGTIRSGFRRFDGSVFDDECYSITKKEYFEKIVNVN